MRGSGVSVENSSPKYGHDDSLPEPQLASAKNKTLNKSAKRSFAIQVRNAPGLEEFKQQMHSANKGGGKGL